MCIYWKQRTAAIADCQPCPTTLRSCPTQCHCFLIDDGYNDADSIHIPMIQDDNTYLSQEKFDELTHELEHMKTVRRREIAEQLEYARSLGDLSENAEYEEARNLQAATEDRIRQIEEQLARARIIEHHKGNAVSLGSFVTIQKVGEKGELTYEVVGSAEANMQEHKISHLSPLGSALMGKKKGEAFQFNTPKGAQKYKIVGIK